MDTSGTPTSYMGSLPGDGQALTFADVDLKIPNDQDWANLWALSVDAVEQRALQQLAEACPDTMLDVAIA